MSKIGIFYGSSTGNTENAAKYIRTAIGEDKAELFNVADISPANMKDFDFLILGISTWGYGELQDDWDAMNLDGIDFSGKKVALFGLGDQESFADTYVDAMGILYRKAVDGGAEIVGDAAPEDYHHNSSLAEVDGRFVGLALDDDNQPELTQDRIADWVKSLF